MDRRILVGIDVGDEDLAEQRIACRRTSSAGGRSSWTVRTGRDVDTLAGFRLVLSGPSGGAVVTLYATATRDRIVGRWSIPPASGPEPIEFRPRDGVRDFSIARGATPFLLDVSTAGAVVDAIDLLVVPVDARAYSIVARQGRCFTAVRSDRLSEMQTEEGAWNRWLSAAAAQ